MYMYVHYLWSALARQRGDSLQHTATHCNTLQHTATHCNTLQHTATQTTMYIPLERSGEAKRRLVYEYWQNRYCNTLQYTATHCNTLQHTATLCNTLQHTATHCNTLQHATHCNNVHTFGALWRGKEETLWQQCHLHALARRRVENSGARPCSVLYISTYVKISCVPIYICKNMYIYI